MGGKDAAHPAVFVYLRAQGSRAFSYHAPPSPPALLAHVRDSARYDGVGSLRAVLAPPRAGLRGMYARAGVARLSAA
jgi:hypothetical protein